MQHIFFFSNLVIFLCKFFGANLVTAVPTLKIFCWKDLQFYDSIQSLPPFNPPAGQCQISKSGLLSTSDKGLGTWYNCIWPKSNHMKFSWKTTWEEERMKRPIVGKATSFDKNADSFGKFLAHYSLLQEAGCSYTAEVVTLCWHTWYLSFFLH